MFRTDSRPISSTRWTPPTWCWPLSTSGPGASPSPQVRGIARDGGGEERILSEYFILRVIQCCGFTFVAMRIRIQHFLSTRIRIRIVIRIQIQILSFDDQKLEKIYSWKKFTAGKNLQLKKIYSWKKFIFFWSKIAIYLSLGLHRGRSSYRRNLIHFCGLLWPSWIRIRIHIPNADLDPADQNKCGTLEWLVRERCFIEKERLGYSEVSSKGKCKES